MLLTGHPAEERLLAYALNLGQRMEAGLDLLWISERDMALPLTGFQHRAMREGVPVAVIQTGLATYLGHHHPPPLVTVMVRREGKACQTGTERMLRKIGCPLTLVSFKSQPVVSVTP